MSEGLESRVFIRERPLWNARCIVWRISVVAVSVTRIRDSLRASYPGPEQELKCSEHIRGGLPRAYDLPVLQPGA